MAPRPTKKSPGLPAPQPPPRPDLALQARPPAHPDLSATPRPAAATMECMAQMMGGKRKEPCQIVSTRWMCQLPAASLAREERCHEPSRGGRCHQSRDAAHALPVGPRSGLADRG